jgi:hypothetical protein
MSQTTHPSPVSPANLPVFITAKATWRAAFRALWAMPVLTVVTFAAMMLLAASGLDRGPMAQANFAEMLRTVLLRSVTMVPLAICACRFVVLGRPTRYSEIGLKRSGLMFLYYSALSVAGSLLIALTSAFGYEAGRGSAAAGWFGYAGYVVGILLSIYIVIRVTPLFSAIAVDAARSGIANAIRDTEGRFWTLTLLWICVMAPLAVSIVVIEEVFASAFASNTLLNAARQALDDLLTTALGFALSAQTYLALANRLGRPSELEAAPPVDGLLTGSQ